LESTYLNCQPLRLLVVSVQELIIYDLAILLAGTELLVTDEVLEVQTILHYTLAMVGLLRQPKLVRKFATGN
jgi:hypothetical protein